MSPPLKLTPTHQHEVKVQHHHMQHHIQLNSTGVNIERVSHSPPKVAEPIKEPKVVVEVESWWKRSGSRHPYGVSTEPPGPAIGDQGPYEFRKILKPTSRNTNRSDGSDRNQTDSPDSGPFDFRKLLRKTDNAPTDTLKRCKGLSTSGSPSNV